MNDENKFEFTYKALTENERSTVESIKDQYRTKTKDEQAYERIIHLDRKIKNTAQAVALAVGVVGALIFGLGMSMVLAWDIYVWGIIVAILGTPFIALAPILNKLLLKKGKEKHGEEILSLSEELLNDK
ncbi:MAG: hypothetical protein IJ437_01440 [Clostridia bacterium]|nr:hypothetical protein [Clostridia bacterium]